MKQIWTCAVALLLVACAPTATTHSFSIPKYQTSGGADLATYAPSEPPLVAIQFPATFSPEADSAWAARILGAFPIKDKEAGEESNEHRARFSANETLNDATYFAAELYRALAERLPEHSVVLDPQRVEYKNGLFVYESLIPGNPTPSLVNLRLATLNHPDLNEAMAAEYVTFGDMITAALEVGAGVEDPAGTKTYLVNSAFSGVCSGDVTNAPLLDCMNGVDPRKGLGKAEATRYGQSLIPARKTRLDITIIEAPQDPEAKQVGRKEWVAIHETVPGSYARAFSPLIDGTVTFASERLAQHRSDPGPFRAAYLSRAVGEVNTGELNARRAALLDQFIAAEKKLLSANSGIFAETLYNGQYGEAFRQLIALEAGLLETRRSVARRENTQNMLMSLAAIGMAASSSSAYTNTNSMMLQNMFTMRVEQATANDQLLVDYHNRFSEEFTAVYLDQSLARELIFIEGEAAGRTLSDLRKKIREIWQGPSVALIDGA